ncbi:hypothetical protein MSG28_000817 [Choristoneura fumiferana]|uniref:Uncharacterized protein n=1 Tax=Choristoneura fumiferana TaxID=7141 RepID=A0ACC0K2E5_CHOFU|nr:hypothetical protein MSG28_000817 [Choristoneura fumiferana]
MVLEKLFTSSRIWKPHLDDARNIVQVKHNKYDIGSGEQFEELAGLIEHLRAFPLTASSGDVLRLLQPVAGGLRARHIPRKLTEMRDSEDSPKPELKYECDKEFQSIKMLEDRHVFTTIEGNRPENVTKNRYRNIVPYDQTRVVLRRRSGGGYINANYVRAIRLTDSNSSVQSSIESLNSVQSLILADELTKTSVMLKSPSAEALTENKCSIKLDLINGNLSQDAVKDKFYIATQGCLSSTKDDFWEMIWQEDVRIIAMITSEVEKGKPIARLHTLPRCRHFCRTDAHLRQRHYKRVHQNAMGINGTEWKKCERYWPLSAQREYYGDLLVKAISESCHENYVLREFDVSDEKDNCKKIYQYQFTTWPDHSTPTEPDRVLAYIEEINRRMVLIMEDKNPPEQNILCVHCSAGVGRTGTFIALDILLDKIKLSGYSCTIDVHNTVKLVRAQRSGMVQNRTQYKFIYLALQTYMEANKIQLKRKSVCAARSYRAPPSPARPPLLLSQCASEAARRETDINFKNTNSRRVSALHNPLK